MSMPSSSALVETTLLDLASPLRQVPAAIPANLIGRARLSAEVILQIRRQDFRRQTALREHNQLKLPLQKLAGNPSGLRKIGATDTELLVNHRRIHEQKEFLSARCAALRHQLERLLDERFGQLSRVGDCRRRTDKRRIGAVVLADAPHPTQHVREMAAEHTTISM